MFTRTSTEIPHLIMIQWNFLFLIGWNSKKCSEKKSKMKCFRASIEIPELKNIPVMCNFICLTCEESHWRLDMGITKDLQILGILLLWLALKMSSFGDWINFSNTLKPRITIFDPHIDPGGYMPAKLVSPDLGLILWFIEFELMSFVCDQVSFSITIQPCYIYSHFVGSVCQVPWLPRALVITIRHMIIIVGPCIVIVG